MENKETIVRETHYTYDENEKLTSMTVHETITNPVFDDGELMTSEIDVKSEPSAIDIAFALVSLGLGLATIAAILKKDK